MPKLSAAEIDAFLDEPGHLLRVGTLDSDGFPSVVPIWFIRHGDDIVFTPRGPSVFLANIRGDQRVGLSIDEDPLPYRKVTVRGVARVVHEPGDDDRWRDLYRQIAKRYVPAEAADAYVNDTIDQPRALIAVSMTDATSRVTTWRMPVGDEDGTGIWHRRYYVDGTHMAQLADSGQGRAAYVPHP
jgi:nitroimidazol reductase NimA-like FMN-containing flavoprotein (pyridoxamine 5'-phosphate oxidase superfamily)